MNALLAVTAALLAGRALAGSPADALFPETSVERCVRSLGTEFLDQPDGAWARGAAAEALEAARGPLREYRDCMAWAGQTPALPAALAAAAPAPVPAQWTQALRGCARGRAQAFGSACKRLLKAYAAGFLHDDADWDAVCRDWCQAWSRPSAAACGDAVRRWAAPELVNHSALIELCRFYALPDAAACAAAPEAGRAGCQRRAAVAQALRAGDPGGCPAADRWLCQAAVVGDGGVCREQYAAGIAAALCAAREAP